MKLFSFTICTPMVEVYLSKITSIKSLAYFSLFLIFEQNCTNLKLSISSRRNNCSIIDFSSSLKTVKP